MNTLTPVIHTDFIHRYYTRLNDYGSSENTFTLRWKFTHVSIWIFFPQSIKLFYESEPVSFRREQKISSGGFSPLATMTQRYWSSRLKVPMRFTVAKNKGITYLLLSYPFDLTRTVLPVQNVSRVTVPEYRENSLPRSRRARPSGDGVYEKWWRGACKRNEIGPGCQREARGLENDRRGQESVLLTYEE